jgi:hypothetical protein
VIKEYKEYEVWLICSQGTSEKEPAWKNHVPDYQILDAMVMKGLANTFK